MSQRAEQGKRNRQRMPETARMVDEFRRVFGPMTRITWAREGDMEVGQRRAPERAMDADQWLRFMATGELPPAASSDGDGSSPGLSPRVRNDREIPLVPRRQGVDAGGDYSPGG